MPERSGSLKGAIFHSYHGSVYTLSDAGFWYRCSGDAVPETRYCRLPSSWYRHRGRADCGEPAECISRPELLGGGRAHVEIIYAGSVSAVLQPASRQ